MGMYPFSRTWWIDEGRILGGRFPGTPDPDETEAMLASLVDGGFSLIVNLQEPDERGGKGKRFSDYAPLVAKLAAERSLRVETCRLSVPDASVPDVTFMRQILDRIDGALAEGRRVYVHCWGGHGRTATVGGCWMVRHGATPEQAFQTIAANRAHDDHLAKMRSPETPEQREFIRRWPEHDRPRDQDRFSSGEELAPVTEDRAVGCLLGLATGDAVGTTVEFCPPGTFEPLTDMVGGGPFSLEPGQWTDDTSMALCLAESLAERRGFDPRDQMERYCRWWQDGYLSPTGECFDIGNTVRNALQAFLASGEAFSGSTAPRTAGNGSLMRLAPVAIAYASQPAEAIRLAGESSRTTHGARECVDACRYFAGLLVGAMRGVGKEVLLSPLYSPVPNLWTQEPLAGKIHAIASASFTQKSPPDIRGTGYVVDSLEAALWAFHRTTSFTEAVLAAANLGDDADTTAAICGQIAGAFYGRSGIPAAWQARVAMRELIEDLCRRL